MVRGVKTFCFYRRGLIGEGGVTDRGHKRDIMTTDCIKYMKCVASKLI